MTDLTQAEQLENVETLDDVFADEGDGLAEAIAAPEKPEADIKGAEDAEEDAEPAEDDAEDADTEASDEDSAPPAEKEQTTVPIAALHDARRKEREAREAYEALRKQTEWQDDANAPDPVADPVAYKQYVRQQVKQEEMDARINASVDKMLETHADYPKMEKLFEVLAHENNELISQMSSHPNPAQFAYETAKAHLEAKKLELYGDLLPAPAPKEQSPAEKRKAAAVGLPDLIKATAQESNSVEKLNPKDDIDEMFADREAF